MTRQLTGRQGDVYFVKGKIPSGAVPITVRPFALGEQTGHAHQLVMEDREGVEMFEITDDAGVTTWMRVTKDGAVSIQHEDHDPEATVSTLPSGWEGEIVVAREYHPEGIRIVID